MKDIYEKKVSFIKRHSQLFDACRKSELPRNWRSASGSNMVELARQEIGYSKSTTAQDIYHSLMNLFQSIKP